MCGVVCVTVCVCIVPYLVSVYQAWAEWGQAALPHGLGARLLLPAPAWPGDDYGPAPDLDHLNPELRAALIEWLTWLKEDIGYTSWRFDYAKGCVSVWGGAVDIYLHREGRGGGAGCVGGGGRMHFCACFM